MKYIRIHFGCVSMYALFGKCCFNLFQVLSFLRYLENVTFGVF